MMRSMFSGVSGLRAHQTRMDVIGNNIANVNTVGFKSSRVTFQDVYNQTLKAAGAPSNNVGGTNPQQVGLGVAVGAIDVLHTPAASERTDAPLDLAIEGDGFFVVSDGSRDYYTRAGNFKLDANGYMVTADGLRVQGWTTQPGQPLNMNVIPSDMNLTNISMPAQATDGVTLVGNLDARADVGYNMSTNMSVYDSLGNEHKLKIDFNKAADNTWNWTITSDDQAIGDPLIGGADGITGGTGTMVFNAEGKILSGGINSDDITIALNNGTNNITIKSGDLIFDANKFTQYAQESYVSVGEMNGYSAGQLVGVGIDKQGYVNGIFSNGQNAVVGIIPLAQFANPGGLSKMGDNLYANTANSGMPIIGQAGTGRRGIFNPGALEMSNVDLSRELTDMIITERGFQANSRVITTSDEMLQELVNLKR